MEVRSRPGRGHRAVLILLAVGFAACSPLPEEPPRAEPARPKSPELPASAPASADPGSDELVFVGTVTSLAPAVTRDPHRRWIVSTRVDRVLSGSFPGSRFSFAIHSPSRSGLETGKQYSIRATKTPTGYRVDEHQWMRSRSP